MSLSVYSTPAKISINSNNFMILSLRFREDNGPPDAESSSHGFLGFGAY
jgi:hypothetical protein